MVEKGTRGNICGFEKPKNGISNAVRSGVGFKWLTGFAPPKKTLYLPHTLSQTGDSFYPSQKMNIE